MPSFLTQSDSGHQINLEKFELSFAFMPVWSLAKDEVGLILVATCWAIPFLLEAHEVEAYAMFKQGNDDREVGEATALNLARRNQVVVARLHRSEHGKVKESDNTQAMVVVLSAPATPESTVGSAAARRRRRTNDSTVFTILLCSPSQLAVHRAADPVDGSRGLSGDSQAPAAAKQLDDAGNSGGQ
ncbi:hypothetical protein PIB30_050157 [Stylosanthes scabra]|uniref:Uncharacterized protein n=1 Tax=Stylosanthes scabra TaxID=79078 RepID=A0ABU6ZG94_9FABA|nr:hypothetical protein [Stylosanthes scabra]